jgi:hypothetical protein
MLEQHVHCVVTWCENPVAWRRVIHLRQGADRRTGEGVPEEGQVGDGLIADVSIYLCNDHRGADVRVDDEQAFPPDGDE